MNAETLSQNSFETVADAHHILDSAIKNKDYALLTRSLMNKEIDFCVISSLGTTVIHEAILKDDLAALALILQCSQVKKLINQRTCNPNSKEDHAITRKICTDESEFVGFNDGYRTQGLTPLQIAIIKADESMIALLAQCGAQLYDK